MDISAIARNVVAIADKFTLSAQVVGIQHEARAGQDKNTKPIYAAAVQRRGVVELTSRVIGRPNGDEVIAAAKVTFTTPFTVSQDDRMTLPNGTVGLVVLIKAQMDPLTNAGYLAEVWLTKE